jgi:hypothetical protein
MKQNRIVIITGTAGGMGALLVERFLANGDTVIATDTSEEALNKLADKFDAGARLRTMAADISDETSCAKLAAFASDKAGRVDVLINCAGFFPAQSFDEMSLADWNKVHRHQSYWRVPDGESSAAADEGAGLGPGRQYWLGFDVRWRGGADPLRCREDWRAWFLA